MIFSDGKTIRVYLQKNGLKKADTDSAVKDCVKRFLCGAEKDARTLHYASDIPDIVRPERGRPEFSKPGFPYFSVSHSGDWFGCAVSQRRIGFDLQFIAEKKDLCRIARRFFCPEEAEYLEKNGCDDFYKLWTAKESYVKYTGTGIDDGFGEFSAVSPPYIRRSGGSIVEGVRIKHIETGDGYAMCVCYAGEDEAEIVISLVV